MKVTVEGLTLERRDGLIAIEGISEVLVRGSEVFLLPIGSVYSPSDEVAKAEASERKPVRTKGKPGKVFARRDAMKKPSDVRAETMQAVRELGSPSATTVGTKLGISMEAACERLKKLASGDLVAAKDTRPKKWYLTGKGLDSLKASGKEKLGKVLEDF